MHANAMKKFIELSAKSEHPLAKVAAQAVEAGIVVPSALKSNLEGAGYEVQEQKLKVLYRVIVSHDSDLIAQGTSDTAADALLQAVFAELK